MRLEIGCVIGDPGGKVQGCSFVLSRLSGVCREVQNLVKSFLECDQAPRNEFTAGAGEFVRMADLEHFRQALVGIEADTVAIGNGDEHEIEKLLESSQSQIESLAEESMVYPAEGTADGSNAIGPRRLRSFAQHAARLFPSGPKGYRDLWNLPVQLSLKPRSGKQLRRYHDLCDLPRQLRRYSFGSKQLRADHNLWNLPLLFCFSAGALCAF